MKTNEFFAVTASKKQATSKKRRHGQLPIQQTNANGGPATPASLRLRLETCGLAIASATDSPKIAIEQPCGGISYFPRVERQGKEKARTEGMSTRWS